MQLLHSQIHKQYLHHLRAVHVLRTGRMYIDGMLLQGNFRGTSRRYCPTWNIQQIGRRRERALKGRRLCAPQHRTVLAEGKADISEFCGIIFRILPELLSVDKGVDPEAIVKMTGLVKPDNWQASIIVMTDGRLGGCAAQIDGGVSPAVPAFVHGYIPYDGNYVCVQSATWKKNTAGYNLLEAG